MSEMLLVVGSHGEAGVVSDSNDGEIELRSATDQPGFERHHQVDSTRYGIEGGASYPCDALGGVAVGSITDNANY